MCSRMNLSKIICIKEHENFTKGKVYECDLIEKDSRYNEYVLLVFDDGSNLCYVGQEFFDKYFNLVDELSNYDKNRLCLKTNR